MLSRLIFRAPTVCGSVLLALTGGPAFGQWFNPCCAPVPPICPVPVAPMYQTVPVTEMRKIPTVEYTQVPVTEYQTAQVQEEINVPTIEYRDVKQVVQRPVVETKYVEQPYTEYRQVIENKTAEIPTMQYQTVTENFTRQRDCGRWITQYHQRPMMTPCEYDNRPDLLGAINRMGYGVRMVFTPSLQTERVYVPNVVAETIPIHRQVAVPGTKTVNYQVSRLVPQTATRRVAVNEVKYVSEEITVKQAVTVMKPKTVTVMKTLPVTVMRQRPVTVLKDQPVTVLRTLPAGSALALSPTPVETKTAQRPVPDPIAINPKSDAKKPTPVRPANPATKKDPFGDESIDKSGQGRSIRLPGRDDTKGRVPTLAEADDAPTEIRQKPVFVAAPDSSLRIGQWVARKSTPTRTDMAEREPEISIADMDSSRR
jgi:hypothetical protein